MPEIVLDIEAMKQNMLCVLGTQKKRDINSNPILR